MGMVNLDEVVMVSVAEGNIRYLSVDFAVGNGI